MGGAFCTRVLWSYLPRGSEFLQLRVHMFEVGTVGVAAAVAGFVEDAHESSLPEPGPGALQRLWMAPRAAVQITDAAGLLLGGDLVDFLSEESCLAQDHQAQLSIGGL